MIHNRLPISRILYLLDSWARWMRLDNHRLGYPSKSIMISTGGASSENAFEEMVDESDKRNVIILDAIITGLPTEQKEAIYFKHLGAKEPFASEFKYQEAMDSLNKLASKRIYA